MAELSRNILVQPLCGQAIVLDTSSNLSFLGLILQTLNEQTEYFRTDVLTEQNLPTVSGRRDQALVFLPQGSSSPSYTPCSPDPPRQRRPPRPPPVFHPSCPLQVDHNIKLMERGRCGAGAGSQFSDRSRPGPPAWPHLLPPDIIQRHVANTTAIVQWWTFQHVCPHKPPLKHQIQNRQPKHFATIQHLL